MVADKKKKKKKRRRKSSIPTWLELPPSSQVSPPVETRSQELPFRELAWEDFQRLCLRLIRLEANVEYCSTYGTPGQDQQGIDIYARIASESKYRVYQCKRTVGMSPSEIRDA